MCNLEVWLTLIILGYLFVLILAITEKETGGPGFWVKVIFWPIVVVVYLFGLLIWLLIRIPRKLFKGICICFYEIKDFFVGIFCSAIEDGD